jgi:hypothetical protein
MAPMLTLGDLPPDQAMYGHCRDCDRTERLHVPSLILRFGPAMSFEAVRRRLRCQGCGSNNCGLLFGWSGYPFSYPKQGGSVAR